MIKCTSKVHMLLRHQSLHIAVEKQQIVHAIEVDMSRASFVEKTPSSAECVLACCWWCRDARHSTNDLKQSWKYGVIFQPTLQRVDVFVHFHVDVVCELCAMLSRVFKV